MKIDPNNFPLLYHSPDEAQLGQHAQWTDNNHIWAAGALWACYMCAHVANRSRHRGDVMDHTRSRVTPAETKDASTVEAVVLQSLPLCLGATLCRREEPNTLPPSPLLLEGEGHRQTRSMHVPPCRQRDISPRRTAWSLVLPCERTCPAAANHAPTSFARQCLPAVARGWGGSGGDVYGFMNDNHFSDSETYGISNDYVSHVCHLDYYSVLACLYWRTTYTSAFKKNALRVYRV